MVDALILRLVFISLHFKLYVLFLRVAGSQWVYLLVLSNHTQSKLTVGEVKVSCRSLTQIFKLVIEADRSQTVLLL